MTVTADERTAAGAFLPPPRVPASVSVLWPPAELVVVFDSTAASSVVLAEQVRAEILDSLRVLASHRPGGDDWRAAREQDRAVFLPREGKGPRRAQPTALAKVIADEPSRYARALALCSSASERLDDLRAHVSTDSLLSAVDKRTAELRDDLDRTAPRAWAASRDPARRSEAWGLVEAFRRAAAEAGRLHALKRWALGTDHAFDAEAKASVSRRTHDTFVDAVEELEAVPEQRRRAARERQQRMNANFRAVAEGAPPPFPVAPEDRQRLAGIRPVQPGGVQ